MELSSASKRLAYPLSPPGPVGLLGQPGRLALTGGIVDGELRNGAVSVWLTQSSGDRLVTMWPGEYRARVEPFELLDELGQVIARAGEQVHLGGGFLPADDPRAADLGRVFFAHSVV
jgi:hypothetical protein